MNHSLCNLFPTIPRKNPKAMPFHPVEKRIVKLHLDRHPQYRYVLETERNTPCAIPRRVSLGD